MTPLVTSWWLSPDVPRIGFTRYVETHELARMCGSPEYHQSTVALNWRRPGSRRDVALETEAA